MRTYSATAADAEASREWYVVDATGQNLGRLATQIANVLKGKHKPIYTPGMDCGDFVVVINADKIRVTGGKLDDKIYYRYSGYPGGLHEVTLRKQLATHPDRVIEDAVMGMLARNKLRRQLIKKLKVYAGGRTPACGATAEAVPVGCEERRLSTRCQLRYFEAVGRRKTSSARVRLYPGTGTIVVNERPFGEYFPRETDQLLISRPLQMSDTASSFNVSIQVTGGGLTGQAGASALGIARALLRGR